MKEKVDVTGVPETMLQTLYARAKETGKPDGKVRDEIAAEIVGKLNYDFPKPIRTKQCHPVSLQERSFWIRWSDSICRHIRRPLLSILPVVWIPDDIA